MGIERWGNPPWRIDFHPAARRLPREVDFAIVGGGFSGLAAAAWLRRLAPQKSVAVFEAGFIGAGSSGHTGGIALGETAAGDLPGLGDVLAGYSTVLRTLKVNCELSLGGAYELARRPGLAESPISWSDSGNLRVAKEIPGGSVNPGKLVSGLARAAQLLGDNETAGKRYQEFRAIWKTADPDRPELVKANEFQRRSPR